MTTTIDSKLLVSHAVESSVRAISDSLSSKFNPLQGFPIMYYDWNSSGTGYSNVFKQSFAKVPLEFRSKPWFTISYSYGNVIPCKYQPRPLLENYIPLYDNHGVKVGLNAVTRLVTVDILCDILTNDGNYANTLALNRTLKQSYWGNLEYSDVFYPQWRPNTTYPEGFIIIPIVPNGYIYIAENEGTTDKKYPKTWPTEVDGTFTDGTITWKCSRARYSKLEMHDFTIPRVTNPNVYEEGIRYQIEFAYAITFAGLEDAEYSIGVIKGFDNHIYELISNSFR